MDVGLDLTRVRVDLMVARVKGRVRVAQGGTVSVTRVRQRIKMHLRVTSITSITSSLKILSLTNSKVTSSSLL